ncbi:MAG: sigma-70 family RNA polymerase sigma factor [Chitinophagales bacterium]
MESPKLVHISGILQDAKTEEFITDANIYLKSDRTNSVFSNEQGRFQLITQFSEANNQLFITCAGYERYKIKLTATRDFNLNVKLKKRQEKSDRAQKDSELVTAALAGNQQAYGKLMGRYRDSIFFMIQKMVNNRNDAEDLTIEAFGKAFQNLSKYSIDYAFSTWLYRIAINNCIDFIRKKRLETFSLDAGIKDDEGGTMKQDIQANTLDPEELYIKNQRILLMRGVIERLNPKYRRLIELRYLKEYTYSEIAKEIDIPLGTVKAQLFRAKELLSNILKGESTKY